MEEHMSIISPGIYLDISHKEYNELSDSIVRNSYLSAIDYVPAKAKADRSGDTPTLLRGRACHALVLEGMEAFNSEFAIAPECDRRTKDGKKIWADFLEESEGFTPLPQEDFIKIYGMNEAVKDHPYANELLEDSICEQTIIWEDKETGIMCRIRPDLIPAGEYPMIGDLKGCKDASDYGFDKSIATYRYYQQAGMYCEGMTKATGELYSTFQFIAVEWEFPHRMGVVNMDPDYLAYGKQEFHRLLRIEKQCRENNYWPHYWDAGARDCYLPAYLGTR